MSQLNSRHCTRCGNDQLISVIVKARASDEPRTVRITCTICDHKWLEPILDLEVDPKSSSKVVVN